MLVNDLVSLHTHTIQRVLELVAYVQQSWQRTQSEAIGRLLACMEDKLDCVIATISWDETGQKISLKVLPQAIQEQSASVWETCVVKMSVLFSYRGRISVSHFVIPPLPLVSNAAAHIRNIIMKHPFLEPA